jgi:hypothetical protein
MVLVDVLVREFRLVGGRVGVVGVAAGREEGIAVWVGFVIVVVCEADGF